MKRTVDEIISILKLGNFDSLIGTFEDVTVEAKGSPYQLSGSDFQRYELAKDVSAFANTSGGIILIGFRTDRDALTAGDFIDACRPFDRALIDIEQCRKTLQDWIYPPVRGIEINCYPSATDTGKYVVAIVVPANAAENKPYVVTRTVQPDGKVWGNQISHFDRVQDSIAPTSAQILRGYLRDGMRFAEISQRLSTIEAFLGNLLPTVTPIVQTPTTQIDSKPSDEQTKGTGVLLPSLTDSDIWKRITEAEKAVDRVSRPNIILAAASMSPSTFPELFHSQSAPIVQLLENPPELRDQGFAISMKGSLLPAEIVQGRLRRVVARGGKLIELWQDGALIAVGQGDDDMLCWFTRSHTNSKPGLPIRNFVLAEVTFNFVNLAVEVFKNADPTPDQLKFFLVLDNMTEEGVPCTLSSARDNRPFPVGVGYTKSAPDAAISSSFTIPFKAMDTGEVVYRLLGGLYAKFGFNYEDMPYIQRDPDKNRITAKSIIGEPWK